MKCLDLSHIVDPHKIITHKYTPLCMLKLPPIFIFTFIENLHQKQRWNTH
ncbi:hypothetical protein [Alphabaculovirus altersperidaniae]|uniref:Uncharacterized protein n=1 Tax=Spodoptera eridania nucleopolyhedrovirus TaxID=2315721 RepID=A0ABX6TRI6_9ABAC|nr:hypothetical protein QKS47_gp009 [Spodoptera eridania nucleopolyhedrovirus]QNV47771.1 hypothetical protein [Spodoptera eridania nucleopolyhedrovirus]